MSTYAPTHADPRVTARALRSSGKTFVPDPACTATRHGTYLDHEKHGCKCPEAATAALRYRGLLATGKLAPGYVNAVGTVRRLRALSRAGHHMADVAALLGRHQYHVARLRCGRSKLVLRSTAVAVAAVYDRLARVPGTSERTRDYAARQGWPLPAAWDGEVFRIDDPDADGELARDTTGLPAWNRRVLRDRARRIEA